MLIAEQKTISDIVREDYRTADVFKKHGINYCCSGQVTLTEACETLKIDFSKVEIDLQEATRTIILSNKIPFSEWPIDFLIDFLINVHHAYLKFTLPSLENNLTSFIDGHRKKYPELDKILSCLKELTQVLFPHNNHEEEIIFPYIKQIATALRRKEPYGPLLVRTMRKPLQDIKSDYLVITALLAEMKSLTNNYTFPEKACTNHQVIYHRLRELHDDLIQHKYLEDDLLYPRALEIESQLLLI